MLTHNEIGKKGEILAVDFLINQDYTILEQNWRYRRAEIDIIACLENTLIFVEVKTRSSDFFGQPEDFVTPKKQKFIASAAAAYMNKKEYDWIFRFDVISVLLDGHKRAKLTHYKDAFFRGLKGLDPF